jgi:Na+-transporting methylmalonyl-CoA/oxaloacetate decarboxylase gamma subunit
MNIESFGYALLTAVVGMAIVFLFLVVLSLLMVVIRAVFNDRPQASTTTGTSGGGTAAGGGAGEGANPADSRAADETDNGVPRWAVAAALAYLSEEEREYAPRATGWTVRSIR